MKNKLNFSKKKKQFVIDNWGKLDVEVILDVLFPNISSEDRAQKRTMVLSFAVKEGLPLVVGNQEHRRLVEIKPVASNTKKIDDKPLDAQDDEKLDDDELLLEDDDADDEETDEIIENVDDLFSTEQKMFISKNCGSMSFLDIAKILYDNNSLRYNSPETIRVRAYIDKYYPDKSITIDSVGNFVKRYNSPKTLQQLITLVKRLTGRDYQKDDLPKETLDCLKSLLVYLSNYRVKRAVENYELDEDRALFESSFIDYTIDKHDLTQTELQAYVNVCSDQIKMHKYEKQLDALYNRRSEELKKESNVSMAVTEAIDKATIQYDKAAARVSKTLKDLEGTRSERMKNVVDKNKTLLSLIEQMQTEEGRRRILHIQKIQAKLVEEEIDRIANVGEEVAKIMGIHKSEII